MAPITTHEQDDQRLDDPLSRRLVIALVLSAAISTLVLAALVGSVA